MFTISLVASWLFYAIAYGTTAHLLFKTSYPHAVLIVGFFLLARSLKLVAEVLVEKQRNEYLTKFQEELAKRQNNTDTTNTTQNVVNS